MRACVRACVCDYPQSLRQAYERAIRTMLGHSDAFSHCQDPATILKSKQYGREPTRRPPLPARTPHSQHSERPRPFKRQRPFTQRHPLPWPVGRACQHHPPPWSLRRRSGPPPARPSPCPGRRLRPLCTPAGRPPAGSSMPVSWQGAKGSGVGPVTAQSGGGVSDTAAACPTRRREAVAGETAAGWCAPRVRRVRARTRRSAGCGLGILETRTRRLSPRLASRARAPRPPCAASAAAHGSGRRGETPPPPSQRARPEEGQEPARGAR